MESSKFWDRHADGYSRRPIDDQESYEHKLRKTAEFLQPDAEILEFGCGTGGTALRHARYVRRVTGVDISARMVQIARGKARDAGVENATFCQGDLLSVARPAESFDMILGLSVMHLIQDREPVFEQIRRLLKPGGYFVSNTVCIAEVTPLFRYVAPIGKALGLMPALSVFRRDAWVEEVTREGFFIQYDFTPPKGASIAFLIAQKKT